MEGKPMVYFKSASTPHAKDALHVSVEKLMEKTNVVEKGDVVAVKLHMGELGNTGYIRPILVRKVVDFIKAKGGIPFLTDTTTLYGGRRGNAVDYLRTAAINGFSIASMGCPVIIADGLRGTDETMMHIDGHDIAVATSIAEADSMVVLSHFKGHGMAGFGGAIKNLGMGCTSKRGKMWQHSASKPEYDAENCILCRKCIEFCPADAITEEEGHILINYERCWGCGACTVLCDQGCFSLPSQWIQKFQKRVAVAAKAALQAVDGRASFMNVLMDITPRCDCCSFAGKPMLEDIGILASRDAVAIDTASYELVCDAAGKDVFHEVHGIYGMVQVEEAEKLGIGTGAYVLESV